jgi:hypothetical protein
MNLPQAQDFEALSFMLYFNCTAEREEGKLMEPALLEWQISLKGAATLHNALMGQLWCQRGFLCGCSYKKVLCKRSFGLFVFGAKPQGRIGAVAFLFSRGGIALWL